MTAYEVLDENAGVLPPGSEKLFFLPHLGGRSCPANTALKGGWFGFSWTHKREHFYRAILEGVAYEQKRPDVGKLDLEAAIEHYKTRNA